MKYIIHHIYDEDGGFGDAIEIDEVVGVLECTPEQLDEWMEKYDKRTVYEEPYASLYCGELRAEPIDGLKSLSLDEDPIPEVRKWPERYGFTDE